MPIRHPRAATLHARAVTGCGYGELPQGVGGGWRGSGARGVGGGLTATVLVFVMVVRLSRIAEVRLVGMKVTVVMVVVVAVLVVCLPRIVKAVVFLVTFIPIISKASAPLSRKSRNVAFLLAFM
ncbi:hypothetical protein T484DRAFT_1825046 [Baffinella frigidus]|nr:hypothetical protein T484DRAFT_1825046 [Cryptophyta sp. CCMP2293]